MAALRKLRIGRGILFCMRLRCVPNRTRFVVRSQIADLCARILFFLAFGGVKKKRIDEYYSAEHISPFSLK